MLSPHLRREAKAGSCCDSPGAERRVRCHMLKSARLGSYTLPDMEWLQAYFVAAWFGNAGGMGIQLQPKDVRTADSGSPQSLDCLARCCRGPSASKRQVAVEQFSAHGAWLLCFKTGAGVEAGPPPPGSLGALAAASRGLLLKPPISSCLKKKQAACGRYEDCSAEPKQEIENDVCRLQLPRLVIYVRLVARMLRVYGWHGW